MKKFSSRAALKIDWADVLTLGLAAIVLTFGLGSYGFYEPHEGHFGVVGYEMLLRGDPVTPTLNGEPYLNKPPLLYWAIATSTAIFGPTEYAARLPLALCGWLTAAIALKWARELWGANAGRAAALMLSTTLGWFVFTHQIPIAVLLTMLLLATNYCLWRFLWEPKNWGYWVSVYLLLGLCVLAKGLLGAAFIILGILGLAISRGNWSIFGQLRIPLGLGVMLGVILPWFMAVERANPGFLHYFLFNEHFQRILDLRWPPDYEVSKVSAWGYLAITAIWWLPWSVLVPGVITTALAPGSKRGDKRLREGILLLAIAAISPIILFLPLSSRLIYYSVPSIPAYIILCAAWWSRCSEPSQKKGRTAVGIIFIVLGLLLLGATFWLPSLSIYLPDNTNNLIVGGGLIAMALGMGLGGCWMLANRPHIALVALFIGNAAACITITHGFVLLQDFYSSKTLMETAKPCLGENVLWTFEGSRELGAAGGMSYYLNRGEDYRRSTATKLPPGWARGKEDRVYRIIMVLGSGGPNRIPPQFPGSAPEYLLSSDELQAYWNSPRPVVFVTDFKRVPNDPTDPEHINLPDGAGEPLLAIAQRKLYGNDAARKLWCEQ